MKALGSVDCELCNGRGALLGSDALPLPDEYCGCVRWVYDVEPGTGPLKTTCARCDKPFTAYVPDNGGVVAGGGLCGECFLSQTLVHPPSFAAVVDAGLF